VENEKRTRLSIIQEANKNSLFTTIPNATTLKEKRELVLEHNPNHYVFGQTRKPWKPWLTYMENMNER